MIKLEVHFVKTRKSEHKLFYLLNSKMGNTQLCGNLLARQRSTEFNREAEYQQQITSALKIVEVDPAFLNRKIKPTFHKIKPVTICSQDIAAEEIVIQEQIYEEESPQIQVKQNRQPMKESESTYQTKKQISCGKMKMMSLEEIMESQQAKIQNQKHVIGVQWNSFVKIKKKNYMQDYTILKEIGRGAYGSVLKIRSKYSGFYRAAKIIKCSSIMKQKNSKQKLFAEIYIPIKLDHPNLAKLFEVFDWNHQFILVMQLCEGGDLFQFIKKTRVFTEAKASEIMRQILSAVYYMHKQNVVHRDIKPENILFDEQSNTLKIIDFGTAAYYNQEKNLTALVGTPYYIAPEVIAESYNEKCDIWSCGVILYILLSGVPPFNGKGQKQIMDKIKSQPVQFTSTIWSRRKKEGVDLIKRMLQKNPENRISAQEALNHPWLNNCIFQQRSISLEEEEVVKNLKGFHFQNKLKAVVYTFIASQSYQNKDKQYLLKVFRQIDKDGDGVIGKKELMTVFNQHSDSSLSPIQIQNILKLVDTNGSGQIDFTQFLVAASNEEKMLEQKQLENAFSYLDSDHSGFITIEEVKAFLDGTKETSEEIKKIFNEVDQNGDGEISKNEFIALLRKK